LFIRIHGNLYTTMVRDYEILTGKGTQDDVPSLTSLNAKVIQSN